MKNIIKSIDLKSYIMGLALLTTAVIGLSIPASANPTPTTATPDGIVIDNQGAQIVTEFGRFTMGNDGTITSSNGDNFQIGDRGATITTSEGTYNIGINGQNITTENGEVRIAPNGTYNLNDVSVQNDGSVVNPLGDILYQARNEVVTVQQNPSVPLEQVEAEIVTEFGRYTMNGNGQIISENAENFRIGDRGATLTTEGDDVFRLGAEGSSITLGANDFIVAPNGIYKADEVTQRSDGSIIAASGAVLYTPPSITTVAEVDNAAIILERNTATAQTDGLALATPGGTLTSSETVSIGEDGATLVTENGRFTMNSAGEITSSNAANFSIGERGATITTSEGTFNIGADGGNVTTSAGNLLVAPNGVYNVGTVTQADDGTITATNGDVLYTPTEAAATFDRSPIRNFDIGPDGAVIRTEYGVFRVNADGTIPSVDGVDFRIGPAGATISTAAGEISIGTNGFNINSDLGSFAISGTGDVEPIAPLAGLSGSIESRTPLVGVTGSTPFVTPRTALTGLSGPDTVSGGGGGSVGGTIGNDTLGTGSTGGTTGSSGGTTTGGNTLGTVIKNTITSLRGVPGLLAAFAYLCGITLGVMGVMKLKEHVEAPNQTQIWDPIKRFLAGGMFLALPTVVKAVHTTVSSGIDGVTGRDFNTRGVSGTGLDAKLVDLLADIWVPMQYLFIAFGYLAGIILLLIGISRLLKTEQEGARGPLGFGTIMTFLVAGVLLSQSRILAATITSMFNGSPTNSLELAYEAGMDPTALGHANAVIGAIMAFVAIIGWISFIRGFFIMRGVAEGNSQASIMAGVTHILGGAVAVNLGGFITAVQSTLGISSYGLEVTTSSAEPFLIALTSFA